MSMKNSNVTIGNRARDLPACSAVPNINYMTSSFAILCHSVDVYHGCSETYCLHLPDRTVYQMGKDGYEERSVSKPMTDSGPN